MKMKMTKWDHLRSNKYGYLLVNKMVKSHTEQLYMCLIKDHMYWLHQVHNTKDTLHGYIYSNIFRNIYNISLKIELENRPDNKLK